MHDREADIRYEVNKHSLESIPKLLKSLQFRAQVCRNLEQHVNEALLHTRAVPLTHKVLQSPKGSFIDREHCLYFAIGLWECQVVLISYRTFKKFNSSYLLFSHVLVLSRAILYFFDRCILFLDETFTMRRNKK